MSSSPVLSQCSDAGVYAHHLIEKNFKASQISSDASGARFTSKFSPGLSHCLQRLNQAIERIFCVFNLQKR